MTLVARASTSRDNLRLDQDAEEGLSLQNEGQIEQVRWDSGAVQLLGYAEEGRVPYVGNVSIENSQDVHIGDKNIYQGPVTIKQILYANGSAFLANSDIKSIKPSDESNGFDSGYRTDGRGASDNVNTCDRNNGVESTNENNTQEAGKDFFWLLHIPNRRILKILGLAILILLLIMIPLFTFFALKQTTGKAIRVDEPGIIKPVSYDQDITINSQVKNPKVRITSRLEWLSQPPNNKINSLNLPVPYVVIHHTATENCSSHAECVFFVRYLQQFDIESKSLDDIAYNFLIGGDGAAYEGRGWKLEGSGTLEHSTNAIIIAFIGTFTKAKPTDIQILICKRLIAQGIELGYVNSDYKLLADKKLSENSETALYKELKSWPHWADTI